MSSIVHLHNAAPEATLAKITFWTDWSIPSLEFDVFLTGYDVMRLDLRDAFDSGNIPITAHPGAPAVTVPASDRTS